MKKILCMSLLALFILPTILAAGGSVGIGGTIGVQEFDPVVWSCDDRVLWDDAIQPWRISDEGEPLMERTNNYIFDGEQYQIDVVVFDKNKIQDVAVDLILKDPIDNQVNRFSVNCIPVDQGYIQFDSCNARIGEESITTFDPATMQGYQCSLTVLDTDTMHGEFWALVEATDHIGRIGTNDEIERWFFNPTITMNVDTVLGFGTVTPGTSSYSTVLLKNQAEGGVVVDTFIAGKNWMATDSNLGRCYDPITHQLVNYLSLGAFSYYASNGAYSTMTDLEVDDGSYGSVVRAKDAEGYVNIHKLLNDGFEESMFNDAELIQENKIDALGDLSGSSDNIYLANLLYPGTTGMSITFKLELPEPCYGSYSGSNSLTIFGEAV